MTEKRIDVVVRTGNSKQAVDSLDKSMRNLGSSADRATDNLQDTAIAADRMKPAARGVQNALGGIGKTAGAAGIQVQQFVGQIQGGQSAMLALSQQGADLGIVMGAPLVGAIIGIGATMASFLIPSLNESAESIEDLIERMTRLGKISGYTAFQIRAIAQANNEGANELAKRNQEIFDQITDLESKLEKMQSAGTGLDTGQFAVPRSAELNQQRYADSIAETQAKLINLRGELDTNNQEIQELNDNTLGLSDAFDELGEKIDKTFDRDSTRAESFAQAIVTSQLSAVEKVEGQMDRLDQLFERGLLSEQSYNEARMALALSIEEMMTQEELKKQERLQRELDMEQKFYDKQFEAYQKHAERQAKIKEREKEMEKRTEQMKLANAERLFDQQLTAASQNSKTMFEINKAYQASKAVMQIPAIAQDSYEYGASIGGPPLGAAFAAVGVAAGLANLRAITSSSFGQTSSTNTSGTPGTPGVVNSPFAQQQPQEVQSQRFVDIRLDDDALLTGSSVKEIINNLLSNDEDVTMNITAQQNNLRRTGAI